MTAEPAPIDTPLISAPDARPPGPLRGARGTRAHTAAQLQHALGWTAGQFGRARAAAVIPEPDMQSPRWSGQLVNQLWERRRDLAEAIPDDLDPEQLRELLGLTYGDWMQALDADLIPAPDRAPYWTRAHAREIAARAEEIRARIPPRPLGAARCAEMLQDATGLDVTDVDVRVLAQRGQTSVVDSYKGWPLYDVAALHDLVGDDGAAAAPLVDIVTERREWIAASVTDGQAAMLLDCPVRDVAEVLAEREIVAGRFGRYPRSRVEAIAGDEDAMEEIRRSRLLGPDQAAEHMEIRRIDFDHVLAAGWVCAARPVAKQVGRSKTVTVQLYRVGDVEDALAIPGVDWEAVRSAKPGEPSPLREHTRLPASRAQIVRAWCGQVSLDWEVEVWPRWFNAADRWEIDWEQTRDGHPTVDEVAASLRAHHGARVYARQISLSTKVGDVIRWARACLEPSTAVVVDTETTGLIDPVIVEIAVIDAATGETLLDTLVNPAGAVMEVEARATHGISDAELADAPTWEQVVPRFTDVVRGRQILAYNAPFDRAAVDVSHTHAGLNTETLPPRDAWRCLMDARSTWARVGHRIPLGGGHRALGDARDARTVLQQLAHAPDRDDTR